jgi:hypothetical protein
MVADSHPSHQPPQLTWIRSLVTSSARVANARITSQTIAQPTL